MIWYLINNDIFVLQHQIKAEMAIFSKFYQCDHNLKMTIFTVIMKNSYRRTWQWDKIRLIVCQSISKLRSQGQGPRFKPPLD